MINNKRKDWKRNSKVTRESVLKERVILALMLLFSVLTLYSLGGFDASFETTTLGQDTSAISQSRFNFLTGAAVGVEEPIDELIGITESENGYIGVMADATPTSCGDVNSALTLSTNLVTTGDCLVVNTSDITINCDGYSITGDAGGGDYGILDIVGYDNVTVQNCNIVDFDHGIRFTYFGENATIINNSFVNNSRGVHLETISTLIVNNTFNEDLTDDYGVYLDSTTFTNITNNTFYDEYDVAAIYLDSDCTDDVIWENYFLGNGGLTDVSGNNDLCYQNSHGNFYNISVNSDQIPGHDCGPTPNGTIYVNSSLGSSYSFSWGGTEATYLDLRPAVYNTYNGTNNTVYLLTDVNATGIDPDYEVEFVRDRVNIDCLNNMFSDPTGASALDAFYINAYNEITIFNCLIDDFDNGIHARGNSNDILIANNTFTAVTEIRGVLLSACDNCNVTNNTFDGDYRSSIDFDSGSQAGYVWENYFLNDTGIIDPNSDTNLCYQSSHGNYYSVYVDSAHVPGTDCGPTPNSTVYVNSSLGSAYNFSWGGNEATYLDLRAAVYNTYNGTNNTVYLLTDVDATGVDSSYEVEFVRDRVTVDCLGYTFSDPTAASSIDGFYIDPNDEITITSCVIDDFDNGIYARGNSNDLLVINNTFTAITEIRGVLLSACDNCNVTNNTFKGDYSTGSLDFDSGSQNGYAWENYFLNDTGITTPNSDSVFCVNNNYGNYYDIYVTSAHVPETDCGPTPNGTVYVNSSLGSAYNFSWGGNEATYLDLRAAVYNTYNGTNNTVYLLTDVDATGVDSSYEVEFVRDRVTVDCLGYTFSDPTAASSIDGFYIDPNNEITITSCTIDDFDNGVYARNNAKELLVINSTFTAITEVRGVWVSACDNCNVTNNTFKGDYSTGSIDIDSGSQNNYLSKNLFLDDTGIDFSTGTPNSCLSNAPGNFYNDSVPLAQVFKNDCGPTPYSNVSVNTSLSTSLFNISNATDEGAVYKTLQEAYYNTWGNNTIFLLNDSLASSQLTTIHDEVILDCQGYTINGTTNRALDINGENKNIIKNCDVVTSENSDDGLYFYTSAQLNQVINCTITTPGDGAEGVKFATSASNNEIINSTIVTGTGFDVYGSAAPNNSIINCSFDRSDIDVDTSGELYVKWYVDTNITDGTSSLSGATVNVSNVSGTNVYTDISAADGTIPTQTLIEFMQDSSNNQYYSTPHNISANLTGYNDNFTEINLTVTNSTAVNLVLANTLFPDLKVNSTDINITGGTIKETDNVEINYSVENLGNTDATNANISFYINDVLNQSTVINLTQANSTDLQFNWTAIGGNYTFDIRADPDNEIEESNETNNNASKNISVKYVMAMDYLGPANLSELSRGKNGGTGEDDKGVVDNLVDITAKVYDFYNASHYVSANCSFYFNDTFYGANTTNDSGNCIYGVDKTLYSFGRYNITVNFTMVNDSGILHTDKVSNDTVVDIDVYSMVLDPLNEGSDNKYMKGEAAVLNVTTYKNGTFYDPPNITVAVRKPDETLLGDLILPENITQIGTGRYHAVYIIDTDLVSVSIKWDPVYFYNTSNSIVSSSLHGDINLAEPDGNASTSSLDSEGNKVNTTTDLYDNLGYLLSTQSTNSSNDFIYPIRQNKVHSLNITLDTGERIYFQEINLTNINNSIIPDVVTFNGTLPSTAKNLTKLVGFESFGYNFSNTTIVIPKNGLSIDTIYKCNGWNRTEFSCSDWSVYTTTLFEENNTHIAFNVTNFSGFAGGAGYDANLTIWDQNDTGLPFGDLAAETNQQIYFYSNYTNSSSGVVIVGECNVSFNDTMGSFFNMSYNATSLVYEYNRTFNTSGSYTWNVSCENATYDNLNANDTITIAAANNVPEVTTPTITPTTAYTNDTLTTNTTYTDLDNENGTVYFLWYLNGTNVYNETNASLDNGTVALTSLDSNNFSKDDLINVSVYANDGTDNSDTLWSTVLTISNTAPVFDENIAVSTVSSGEDFNYDVNCSDSIDSDTITYYDNTTLFNINSSNGYINDTPIESEAGIYNVNISCSDGTVNTSQTLIYTINDGTAPQFSNITNTSLNFKRYENFTANITVNDSVLDDYIFSTNATGSWVNGTATDMSAAAEYNVSTDTNISLAQSNQICWYYWANDSSGNSNQSTTECFTVVNTIPVFDNFQSTQTVDSGKTLSYDLNCSDTDDDTITYYDNTTLFDINSATGVITDTPDLDDTGVYNVNLSCDDGNVNTSQNMIYTVTGVPNVTLVSPATAYSDTTVQTTTNLTFVCNVSDDQNLENVSLYLAKTGAQNFSLNQTTNLSGITNITNWTLTLGQGTYTWNCLSYDNDSNEGRDETNRTVSLSYTAPSSSSSSSSGGGSSSGGSSGGDTTAGDTTGDTTRRETTERETTEEITREITDIETDIEIIRETLIIRDITFEPTIDERREVTEDTEDTRDTRDTTAITDGDEAVVGRAITLPVRDEVISVPINLVKEYTLSFKNGGGKPIKIIPTIEELELIDLPNQNNFESKLRDELSQGNFTDEEFAEKLDARINLEKLKEKENIKQLVTNKQFSFADEKQFGINGFASVFKPVSGSLLESKIVEEEIIVKAGQSLEKKITIVGGISLKSKKVKLGLESVGEILSESEVEVTEEPSIGSAVEVDIVNDLIELYVTVPSNFENNGETGNSEYLFEVEIIKDSNSSGKMVELYGPFNIKSGEGYVFTQGIIYDRIQHYSEHLIKVKIFQDDKLVAQNKFDVNFGNEKALVGLSFGKRLFRTGVDYSWVWLLLVCLSILGFAGYTFRDHSKFIKNQTVYSAPKVVLSIPKSSSPEVSTTKSVGRTLTEIKYVPKSLKLTQRKLNQQKSGQPLPVVEPLPISSKKERTHSKKKWGELLPVKDKAGKVYEKLKQLRKSSKSSVKSNRNLENESKILDLSLKARNVQRDLKNKSLDPSKEKKIYREMKNLLSYFHNWHETKRKQKKTKKNKVKTGIRDKLKKIAKFGKNRK